MQIKNAYCNVYLANKIGLLVIDILLKLIQLIAIKVRKIGSLSLQRRAIIISVFKGSLAARSE
ncbi:hypothetical protein BB778_21755 [Pluralibacter gergoviae]|nr:hypothetical protein BB778_21755 [Pluralibacter gergoviae]